MNGVKARLKNGGPDRDLAAGGDLGDQRPHRAEEDDEGGGDEQQVVDHEPALAADGGEDGIRAQYRRAPGVERQRATDEGGEDPEQVDAALGVVGKGVHRGDDAGADDEGADQAEGEGEDGEQDRPAFKGAALLDHDGGVEERAGDEPGHEGDVLDRIPGPPAAPAELVVGPDRAHRDADGEEHPGEQRPGADPARPGGVDAALDEGGDGEGIGHREADVAEIEERRVEGEAGVLQERVEVVAVDRRVREAEERVRGEQDEAEEGDGDRRLDAEDAGAEGGGQVAAPPGDHGAEEGQDEHPEQHRALVVAPGAGEPVDQRLRRVRVERDEPHREVGDREGVHQRREGRGGERELQRRGGDGEAHPVGPAALGADHRNHHLNDGDEEGEDQGEMPEFDAQFRLPCCPRAICDERGRGANSRRRAVAEAWRGGAAAAPGCGQARRQAPPCRGFGRGDTGRQERDENGRRLGTHQRT